MDGQKLLENLNAILRKELLKLSGKSSDEVETGMLSAYEVLLILLKTHEENMAVSGFSNDEIKQSKKMILEAHEDKDEFEDIITMPRGIA